jgi:hypothetical protein
MERPTNHVEEADGRYNAITAKKTWLGLKKLDDRSRPMMMISYEPGRKAYRLYDPAKKCLHLSLDNETVLVQFIGTED